MYRIGIDVGGTFTDVTLLNAETGAYYTYKLSSTLHDQSEAIANWNGRLSETNHQMMPEADIQGLLLRTSLLDCLRTRGQT